MKTTSEKFKALREEKRLTQQALANILSVTKQNIANVESGHQKPTFDLMKKMIEELNINTNWLIADVGTMYNQTPNEVLKEELRKEF
ncbi:MAG: helix-turn-helix transcriptional regulator, partial [Clostridia bacterium]|nr:helix-turn-helix transcriptional regulator [Clostridia bacterium]